MPGKGGPAPYALDRSGPTLTAEVGQAGGQITVRVETAK